MERWETVRAWSVQAGDILQWPSAADPEHTERVESITRISPSRYRLRLRDAGEAIIGARMNLNRMMLTHRYWLQPGQPGEGMGYNVKKVLPYPIQVSDEGAVLREVGAYQGRVVGFADADDYLVALPWEDFVRDPDQALGKRAVFAHGGSMWTQGTPITKVIIREGGS